MNRFRKKMRAWTGASVLICSVLFLSIAPTMTKAIEYGGLGGRPANPDPNNPRTESIFIYRLMPGQQVNDGVLVVNNTDETKNIYVYAADSVPSTDGGYACRQRVEEKKGVGSWITLEKESLTLESKTSKVIPFKVLAPSIVEPGEHNGCILIQEHKTADNEKAGMNLSFRTGLRVVVTIPGDIVRELKIKSFTAEQSKGKTTIHSAVQNLGNVSIDTSVKVYTKDMFGRRYEEDGGEYPVLRGDVFTLNSPIKRSLLGGWYTSRLVVRYDQGEGAGVGVESGAELTTLESGPISFFMGPEPAGYAVYIAIVGLLLFLFFLWIGNRKHDEWIDETWVDHEVKRGQDIRKVAQWYGINWKELARENDLKPPYALEPGTTIKVPPTKPKKGPARRKKKKRSS